MLHHELLIINTRARERFSNVNIILRNHHLKRLLRTIPYAYHESLDLFVYFNLIKISIKTVSFFLLYVMPDKGVMNAHAFKR